jgi:subtilisin-like proprotein convertase family protein
MSHFFIFRSLFSGQPVELEIKSNSCRENYQHYIRYLEHIQVFISVEYSRRGDLNISIESPQGTDVTLFHSRPNDIDSKDGFENFPLVSVHTWGENPFGIWKLRISDNVTGILKNF